MKKIAFGALVAAAALVPAQAAFAQSTPPASVTCSGALNDQIVQDVTIRYQESCTLTRVIVLGDVIGRSYAGEIVLDRSAVVGEVRASLPASVELRATVVNGALRVIEPGGGVALRGTAIGGTTSITSASGPVVLGSATGAGNVFRGGVTLSGNAGGVSLQRNVFGAGLSLLHNYGADVSLTHNLVRGTLACEGNDPAPSGTGNLAAEKTGQCEAL